MSNCILCSTGIPPDAKPEHVWLKALGGRMETRFVICSDCNGRMGSGPDKALAESVWILRNLMNFPDGKGKPPPTITGQRHEGRPVAIKPGGVPVPAGGSPFTITNLPDGRQIIEVRLGTADPEGDLLRAIPHLSGALKLTEEQVRELLAGGRVERVSQRIGRRHYELSLGGVEAMRSMLKTCMTLWACCHGTAELLKPIYNEAREFVNSGKETGAKIYSISSDALDPAAEFLASFGPFFNLAYVASDNAGRAIGYFRLYNICAWRFVLCEKGGIPSAAIGLVSNPANPGVWRSFNDPDLIPHGLVADHMEFDGDSVRQRLASMLESYLDEASKRELERIIEEAVSDEGLKEGDTLTEPFLDELASRAASWVLGVPYRQPIDPQKIIRSIPEPLDKSGSTND